MAIYAPLLHSSVARRNFSLQLKYQGLLQKNIITHDDLQQETITKLQKIYDSILAYGPPPIVETNSASKPAADENDSLFEAYFKKQVANNTSKTISRRRVIATAPNGMYIYGKLINFIICNQINLKFSFG